MNKNIVFFEDQPIVAQRMIELIKEHLQDSSLVFKIINYKNSIGGLRSPADIAEEASDFILDKGLPSILLVDRSGDVHLSEDDLDSFIGVRVVGECARRLCGSGRLKDFLVTREFFTAIITKYHLTKQDLIKLGLDSVDTFPINKLSLERVIQNIRNRPHIEPMLPYFGKDSSDILLVNLIREWASIMESPVGQNQ